jgi:hypothetical protein
METSRIIPVSYTEGRGRISRTVTSEIKKKGKFELEMEKKLQKNTDNKPTISLYDRDDEVGNGEISRMSKEEVHIFLRINLFS